MNVQQIEAEAIAELKEDDRLEAVKEAKERIVERKMRPLWHKIFPFVITIKRR